MSKNIYCINCLSHIGYINSNNFSDNIITVSRKGSIKRIKTYAKSGDLYSCNSIVFHIRVECICGKNNNIKRYVDIY